MDEAGWQLTDLRIGKEEVDALLASLTAAVRSRAGARHLMALPGVVALASDVRLLRLADGRVPYRATLFDKSRAANWQVQWHQDTALPLTGRFDAPGWGPWSEKAGVAYAHAPGWALERIVALRVHLDEAQADNGPLRVLGGTHRLGVLSDEQVAEIARSREATEILAPRGGIMLMRPLLIHASSKATADRPRRVLHLEYADRLDLAPGIRLAVA